VRAERREGLQEHKERGDIYTSGGDAAPSRILHFGFSGSERNQDADYIKKREEWKGFGRKGTREMGGEGRSTSGKERNGRQRGSNVGRGGGCSADTAARMGGEMRCNEEEGNAGEKERMGEGNLM
jgi:hypothetical protein